MTAFIILQVLGWICLAIGIALAIKGKFASLVFSTAATSFFISSILVTLLK